MHSRSGELADAAPPPFARDESVARPARDESALRRAAGREAELGPLYGQIGEVLRERFGGWDALVLSRQHRSCKGAAACEPARRQVRSSTAPIECRLLELPDRTPTARQERRMRDRRSSACAPRRSPTGCARTVAHRAASGRRARTCTASASTTRTSSEYAVAVDLYEQPPTCRSTRRRRPSIRRSAEERLGDVIALVPEVLEVPRERRLRQDAPAPASAASTQYEQLDRHRQVLTVHEGGHRFLVNFTDYLDTGLFLDHRPPARHGRESWRAASASSTCSPTPARPRSTPRPAARARR